jgi:hypothetical protein
LVEAMAFRLCVKVEGVFGVLNWTAGALAATKR